MGDKYIIELEEKPFHDDNGDFLYRVKGFNSLVFDMNGIQKLTPYTEPDMEKVREDAFKNGYDAACKDIDIKSKTNAAYQKGLEDAWEAARKICTNWVLSDSVLSEIFGMNKTIDDIMKEITASEAIEEIRQYEQRKEKIKVGDEVITASGKAVVMGVGPVHFEYVYANGHIGSDKVKNVKKTGRHFTEIAEVLRKMKETE